jgi:uncharacterized integral membrane protein
MPRWLLLPSVLIVAVLALVFSVLNRNATLVDLYFCQFELPLGLLLMLLVLFGFALAGSILYVAVILPQRLRIGALRRTLETVQKARPEQ